MPQLNAIGIVCSDMRRSIAFYGELGIEFPEGNGHVEATLPNGVRLMLDTEEVIESFRPDWSRAAGNQLALAFECESPDQVDELYRVAIKRSLGYRLGDDTGPGAGPSAFGHVGNGMFAYADPERELAVAFLRNAFASPPLSSYWVSM